MQLNRTAGFLVYKGIVEACLANHGRNSLFRGAVFKL